MKRLALSIAMGICAAPIAQATDWEVDLDLRLLNSDGLKSFLDGGPGELRYGADKSGVQLGRFRLALSQSIGELWSVHLDASIWRNSSRACTSDEPRLT